MTRLFPLLVMVLVVVFPNIALSAGIANTPWVSSNLQELQSSDKAAIAHFINNDTTYSPVAINPKDIGEFAWVDLAGNGRIDLVVTLDVNGRAFFNALVIFGRDTAGNITYQELRGHGISDLNSVIGDLNASGKDELIIPTQLISYSSAETYTWPAVYRSEDGRYVEASRYYPSFYDDRVLPSLSKRIAGYQANTGKADVEAAAILTMERDKILRVLGRNPTAGLQEAYKWMNSDNPRLLQNAAATFQDIGGHEQALRMAADAEAKAQAKETSNPHE